ncbi:SDR family NAD(P)-dependent oxidoreductase [Vibrio sp. RC27]
MYNTIAIIGSSGAIGKAFTQLVIENYPMAVVHTFSRYPSASTHQRVLAHQIDYSSEQSIATAAEIASKHRKLDLVFVATGLLHNDTLAPEKALKDITSENLTKIFHANTVTPALIAKHFLPKLNKSDRSIFAAISARVGSISDNQLGGWYSYRASKSALNMIIKSASIEMGRSNKNAIIVGVHPGTVDSSLSKPFQKNVQQGKLFSPAYSAERLLDVLNNLSHEHSGGCFAWDGKEIQP